MNGWQHMGQLDGRIIYWHPLAGWAIERDAQHLVGMSPDEVERFKAQADEEGEPVRIGPKGLVEGDVFEGREC